MEQRRMFGGRSQRRAVLSAAGLLAAGVGAGMAAACGVAGSGGTAADTKAVGKTPADITYATTWTGDSLAVLNQGLDIFRQKYPTITVNVAPQPSRDQTIASFAAGSGPDSLRLTGQIGPRLYEGGQILEISDRIKTARLNLDKDFISSKLEQWSG